jgi:hypothetical protein
MESWIEPVGPKLCYHCSATKERLITGGVVEVFNCQVKGSSEIQLPRYCLEPSEV